MLPVLLTTLEEVAQAMLHVVGICTCRRLLGRRHLERRGSITAGRTIRRRVSTHWSTEVMDSVASELAIILLVDDLFVLGVIGSQEGDGFFGVASVLQSLIDLPLIVTLFN